MIPEFPVWVLSAYFRQRIRKGESMSLYVIGDLHLSLGCDKPMDVFGGRWENYTDKITEGFSRLSEDDTCVLCGDLSWGMSLEEALPDFRFIDALPGRKILLKGNHDYWWETVSKMTAFFAANCYFYGETALCGTRGWFFEEEKGGEHDKKIMLREVGRLESSLIAAGDKEKYAFLHYPPKCRGYECREILDLLEQYAVKKCFYGHIHSAGMASAFTGEHRGTSFELISADRLMFAPKLILA